MQPISLEYYRNIRFNMVEGDSSIRDFRVRGDLIRHCELHRDMQRGLVRLRRAYYGEGR